MLEQQNASTASARPTSATQIAVLNGMCPLPAAATRAGAPSSQPDITIAAQSTNATPSRLEVVVLMAGA
jgi:hypothetical protein